MNRKVSRSLQQLAQLMSRAIVFSFDKGSMVVSSEPFDFCPGDFIKENGRKHGHLDG